MADGKDRDWLGMIAPIERRDMLNGLLVGTGLALAGCAPSGSEGARIAAAEPRSEEHTSELQSLMRISSAGFCLKKKKTTSNLLTNTKITRINSIPYAHKTAKL